MSEELGAPKPSKLKLSSSKSQPEKQSPAPTPSSDVCPASPKLALTPKEAPKTVEPQVPAPKPKLSPTPPPLPQKSAPRAATPVAKKTAAPTIPIPSPPPKDDPLGSILIIAALLLILAAASGGIWYLLRNNEEPPSQPEADAIPLKATPTNPIERAKATIEKVPHSTLDPILDPEVSTKEIVVTAEPTLTTTPTAPTATQIATTKAAVSEYLQSVHIEGVRTGPRARIMLNGENYNINDTVDASTGLKFIGTRDKKLQFKDRNGIVYVKSF